MDYKLTRLEPVRVFHYFEELCSIMRPCGHTGEAAAYLVSFAGSHGLRCKKDDYGNVVIYSGATAGQEDAPTVILQAHMDTYMSGADRHDILKTVPEINYIDEYVFSRGQSMGAESAISIAYILSILESDEIEHPAIEAIFTADEGDRLRGALALDVSGLSGRFLISIDERNESQILTSSAGGLSGKMYVAVRYKEDCGEKYKIIASGFQGGHSGTEIHRCPGNANIIMGRLLHFLSSKVDFRLKSLTGGLMPNAIPRGAECEVILDKEDTGDFESLIQDFERTIQNEYRANEHNISIYCDYQGYFEEKVLYKRTQERLVFLLNTVPDGIQKISQEAVTYGLVQSSINTAIMRLGEREFFLESTIRSSITSEKEALSDKLRYLTETIGGRYEEYNEFPAWEYKNDSVLAPFVAGIYKSLFGKAPMVTGVHAGRECGVFAEKMPGIDMVSIGPDIIDAHTVQEKLSIASAQRVWIFLLEILRSFKSL